MFRRAAARARFACLPLRAQILCSARKDQFLSQGGRAVKTRPPRLLLLFSWFCRRLWVSLSRVWSRSAPRKEDRCLERSGRAALARSPPQCKSPEWTRADPPAFTAIVVSRACERTCTCTRTRAMHPYFFRASIYSDFGDQDAGISGFCSLISIVIS